MPRSPSQSYDVRLRRLLLFATIFCSVLCAESQADKRVGTQSPQRYRRQHALIIGINYDTLPDAAQLEVPQLHTAENDAQAVRDALINQYGYANKNVHLLLGEDATLNGIRSLFGAECLGDAQTVTEDDSVLIFYAGHGVRQQKHGAEDDFVGMLYPADLHVIDGKGVDPVSCLRIDDILRMLQDYCAARHKLLILDSCHSGEVFNFKSSRSAGVNRGFRTSLFRSPAIQAIAAAQATQVAADSDDSGEHSPFTSIFLQALLHGPSDDTQALYTASQLFAFIPNRIRRMENVSQDPRGGWIDGEGDFYFFPKSLQASIPITTDSISTSAVDSSAPRGFDNRWLMFSVVAGAFLLVGSTWKIAAAKKRKAFAESENVLENTTDLVPASSRATRAVDVQELYLRVIDSPYAYRAPSGTQRVSVGRQRRKAGQTADQGNDFVIRVPDSDKKTRLLSRRHLEITRVGPDYFVTDCSTAGTLLNDQRLIRGVASQISSGDKLTVAEVLTLEVRIRSRANHARVREAGADASSTVELSPWNNKGVVVEATLGDLVTMEDDLN